MNFGRRNMFNLQSGITLKLSNDQSINNKFNDILVVGNGFDLFLGHKTKYSDFFYFISLYRILYLIKDSYKYPIGTFSTFFPSGYRSKNQKLFGIIDIVDTYLEIYCDEDDQRYKKLNEAINSTFFKWLLTKIFADKYSFLFEEIENKIELDINKAYFDNLSDNLYKLIIKYQKEIESSLVKAEDSCNGWTDIEQLIEYLVLSSDNLKCKFESIKNIPSNQEYLRDFPNKANSYYDSLQKFCDEFSLFLKAEIESHKQSESSKYMNGGEDFSAVASDINSDYIKSLKYRSNGLISNISFLELKCILDFNYTKSTDKLIDLCASRPCCESNYHKPYVYHINGEIDCNNLIFGYGRDKAISVSKECFCFEKFTQRIIKNTQFVDFKNLLADKFNVLIFGHSCSLADRDVIHKLLSSDNLGIAVIFCHDIPALISISNNLLEILGQDRMETLLDYSEYNKLNNKISSSLPTKIEKGESNNISCLNSFHSVLFFCVESKNDKFLQNKY